MDVLDKPQQQHPTMEVTGRVAGIREPEGERRGYGVYVSLAVHGPGPNLEIYVPTSGFGVTPDGKTVDHASRKYMESIVFGSLLKVTVTAADETLLNGPRFRLPTQIAEPRSPVKERWGNLSLKGFVDLGFVRIDGEIEGSGGGTLRVVVIDGGKDDDAVSWITRSTIHRFEEFSAEERDEAMRAVDEARSKRRDDRRKLESELKREAAARPSLVAVITSFDPMPADPDRPGSGQTRMDDNIYVEIINSDHIHDNALGNWLIEMPTNADLRQHYSADGGVFVERGFVRKSMCRAKHNHGDGSRCRMPTEAMNIVMRVRSTNGEGWREAAGAGFMLRGAMRDPSILPLVIGAVKGMGFRGVASRSLTHDATVMKLVELADTDYDIPF